MKEYKNGVWSSDPQVGERVRVYDSAGGYVERVYQEETKPNKIVITSHDKRAIVARGGELAVDIEMQDIDGNILDVTDSFALPIGKVGAGNYTTLMIPFVHGKASRSYIWNDAGEFEITSAMINMHLDESSKLDFDGFNITVAG